MASAEEIAQVAMGNEYMGAVPTGNGNPPIASEQDWRSSGLPPRDESLAMSYQRNRGASQLPLQGQPSQPQRPPPPRQPYGYTVGAYGGGPPAPGGQKLPLKPPFPGAGMISAPNSGSGPPPQPPSQAMNGNLGKILRPGSGGLGGGPRMPPPPAGVRFAPNGQPIGMPATSMGGYGPPSGKGPSGSMYNTMAGAGYGPGVGYGPGMNGGYGGPGEFNSREGGYGYGMQDYEMASADYSMEQEGGWGHRWDPSAGVMRGLGGNGQQRMMGGGRGGMGHTMGPPMGGMGEMRTSVSRAIFINQVPAEVTYEELCDAVGAFGNLESVKLLPEKRQAFINFVEPQAAYQLMVTTQQQIMLQGKPLVLFWAKTRPVVKEVWIAIRNGATRNLYVANVPELLNDAQLTALFAPFGELESVRIGPKKGAAFVNYTSIAAAIKAKENVHKQHAAAKGTDTAQKPLLINFTSAQQNCMRARGVGRPACPPSVHHRGAPHFRGYGGANGHERGFERNGRSRLSMRSNDRSADGESTSPAKSRALYLGSVPDSVELAELASRVEEMGVIESMRLVRPKSCAFINFADETVARALQAKFTASDEAAPEINGKRLTVNFAKARPCTAEQKEQIAQGARRKLSVRLPESIDEQQLKDLLGHKADMLTEMTESPCDESEAEPAEPAPVPAAAVATAEGGEGGEDADVAAAAPVPRPRATHKVMLAFTSVATAIAVKASLEGLSGANTVSGVEFVVEPVSSAEEVAALLPSEPEPSAEPQAEGADAGADEEPPPTGASEVDAADAPSEE